MSKRREHRRCPICNVIIYKQNNCFFNCYLHGEFKVNLNNGELEKREAGMISGRDVREMENIASIFNNMSIVYEKAIKKFNTDKVKDYFVKKGYKIDQGG